MWRTLKSLLDDASAEPWGFIAAVVLNLVFLGLAALLLRPPGMSALAVRLTRGSAVFWGVVIFAAAALAAIHGKFRVDLYTHSDAFLLLNLAVSASDPVTPCS